MVPPLITSTEIEATPEVVRKVFFDFPSYPLWSRSRALTLWLPTSSTTSQTPPLAVGSKIAFESDGTKMEPTIIVNTPELFEWEGGLWPLLKARHRFRFLPGTQAGTTLLMQEETFWGLLGFLFATWWPTWAGGMRGKTELRFQRWNEELRGWVEGQGRRD